MENKDYPAFPRDGKTQSNGLSKRELFALKAMQAWVSCDRSTRGYDYDSRSIAKKSVEMADALLKQLEQ